MNKQFSTATRSTLWVALAASALLPGQVAFGKDRSPPPGDHRSYDHSEDRAPILLRRWDDTYQRVDPGGHGPYHTGDSVGPADPDDGTTYTGVYDRRGNRVGTVEDDAGGARFYNNRGDRR